MADGESLEAGCAKMVKFMESNTPKAQNKIDCFMVLVMWFGFFFDGRQVRIEFALFHSSPRLCGVT